MASYEDTLNTYYVNLHGGSYKKKQSGGPYDVEWWNQHLRRIPFWRYPDEVVEDCRRGANPGFCYEDVTEYEFQGNYSQLPHEKEAEDEMIDSKVKDSVLEPLRVDERYRHLVRFSPVWMVKKKKLVNELKKRYRLLVDNSASLVNVRTPRLPCHFPNRELVLEKLGQSNRSLGEADTSDCFHVIDTDERYRWLVALTSDKHGPL